MFIAIIRGLEINPVCSEERTALHACFLTNTSNCLKGGQWLKCFFVLRTLNVLLSLNVHVLIDANFMFVVTPAASVFLTEKVSVQIQRKSE